MIRWLAFLICLHFAAASAHGQTVRGTVRDDEGAVLRGAFVVLLDSAGNTRVGTLTNDVGEYALRVSTPGRFAIRAELIGHKSTTTLPFFLSPDSVRSVNVLLPVSAIELSGVTAKAARRCVARPEAAAQTQRLWEEVRKALRVTAWAQRYETLRLATVNYVRMLDPYTLQVRSEESRYINNRPYAAVDPDTLARWGFARRSRGDSIAFFGPDAELLLSNAFLDTHCFNTQLGNRETAGLVGLSFQPVPHRNVPEIVGTLWVDPRTSELKHIEYRYINLPRAADERTAQGRTYFRRTENGVWLVDHWYIRMPLRYARGRGIGGLAGLREEGGEVIKLGSTERETVAPSGVVQGVVYDSVRGAPLANAEVYISGTSYKTRTDAAGRFVLEGLRSGSYHVAFAHPLLDSLPAFPRPAAAVVQGDTVTVALAIPSQQTLVTQACPEHPDASVLTGYVYDAAWSTLAGVDVTATYALGTKTGTLHSTTEETGRYVLCAVPARKLIHVSAQGVRVQLARLDKLRFARLDLPPL